VAPDHMREALKPGHSYDDGTSIALGHTGDHSSLGDGAEGRPDDGPPPPREGSDASKHRS
jgi:hypothetical protein